MAVLTFNLWQTLAAILQNRLFAETDILLLLPCCLSLNQSFDFQGLVTCFLSLSLDQSISKGS